MEKDLIYLCTIGMEDPLRPDIEESISHLKFGQIEVAPDAANDVNIRILTGDHIDTAKYVGLRTGIV